MHRRHLDKTIPSTLTSMNNLALLYQDQGANMLKQSLCIWKHWLDARGHLDRPSSPLSLLMNNLASLYTKIRKYAEKQAPLAMSEALAGCKKALGQHHSASTLTSMNNLASLYQDQGKYAEAGASVCGGTGWTQEEALGEVHSDTLTSMNNLALLYQNQGKYAEAEPLYVGTH